ncbi:transcriptional repressor [Bacteroides sp. OF04-15BH]|jgi:Fe2+ or Zn2+ uptake regulation protein|nr:transcriptional repressor [Bacteroides sp. OF04-15BH]
MMDNALNTLLEYGIHPSVQRIAIMDYLQKHHTHPTVDEVYVALHKEIPTLSKTTVYNTLKLFAEQGAAQMLTIDERKVCFDGVVTPHVHFLCKTCGKVFDFPLTEEQMYVGCPEKETGFEITEAHVYYKGYCSECKKKNS